MACQSCFNTLLSFSDLCHRERDLISFLQDHLVLPGTVACPKCKKDCYLAREDTRLRFRCQRQVKVPKTRKTKKCPFSVTAKKGTFFEGSHLDVPTVCRFVACWLMVHYPKKRFIMEELQVSSRTFVDWSSLCREVCMDYLTRRSVLLGGEGVTVEIDEAKIGKRKCNRGRRIEGQWIFGGYERGSGNVFIVPVPDRTTDTLLELIREHIRPGTTIISDCLRFYQCLGTEGFRHLTVNHNLTFVDPDTGAHTQNIERLWRDVRGGIPRYGRKEAHMSGYLAEFLFKRAVPRTHLIHEFMRAAADLYPPSPVPIGEDPEEPVAGPSSAP
ncbi:uncharacterized protein LOC116172974 [Photinus pyralis]|uniref:uncharacterized protein LOC116172974 n=1 Tax=Photinus pyralis TaxID=7054 RepID=UPI0012677270|nr:uncharacterized protein LOC116172974 [Photinus pyralis]